MTAASILVVVTLSLLCSVKTSTINSNVELKKFCLIFALPGRQNGPNIPQFKSVFDEQLASARNAVFNSSTTHVQAMSETKKCEIWMQPSQYTAKCAYNRLFSIKEKFVIDLNKLNTAIPDSFGDKTYMFIVYLASWFFDNVFLGLDCGPVDKTTLSTEVC